MRRPVIAALLAVLLLTVPVGAQILPMPSPEPEPLAPGERVLIDAELWMDREQGQSGCWTLPGGTLTITAGVVLKPTFPETANVSLRMHSMMGARGGDYLEMAVTDAPTTTRRVIAGGPYCWFVESSSWSLNEGVPRIALRMTLTQP